MKIPKEKKLYCRKCKKHTVHKLKTYKAGKARPTSIGQRKFQKKHVKGYGGMVKHIKLVKKQTKSPTFIAECTECHKKIPYVIPKRMKKIEFEQ
jgi:large subunit ribosomal protein L44e